MAAFKTGIELQREKLQELAALSAKTVGGRTPTEQGNRQLGALLGTMLAGKALEGSAGVAAGDIIAAQEKPPETAADWANVQKQFFQAGLEEDGLALTAKIKGLQEVEKSFKDTGKTTKPITSEADRELVGFNIAQRFDDENSVIGTVLKPMLDEGASEAQKAQAGWMRGAIAEEASAIHQQLIDKGIEAIPKSLIIQSLLDDLESTDEILSPETGFLFFKEDAGVDSNKLQRFLIGANKRVMSRFVESPDKPVEVAEHQPTTRAPGKVDAQTGLPEAATPTTESNAIVGKPIVQELVDKGVPLSEGLKKTLQNLDDEIDARYRTLQNATDPKLISALQSQLNELGIKKARISKSLIESR